jgi:hypothetical protein
MIFLPHKFFNEHNFRRLKTKLFLEQWLQLPGFLFPIFWAIQKERKHEQEEEKWKMKNEKWHMQINFLSCWFETIFILFFFHKLTTHFHAKNTLVNMEGYG